MAIDYGSKRIGLAAGDAPSCADDPILPYPVATVTRSRSLGHDIGEILRLAEKEKAQAFVIGLPLHADGSHGASAQAATEFANAVKKRTTLPVEMFNEWGTTLDAEEIMLDADVSRAKRRDRIDRMAAASILTGFLRHQVSRKNSVEDIPS